MAAKAATSQDALVLQDIIKSQQWRSPAWGGSVDENGNVSISPFLMGFKDVPLWIWEMPQQDVAYTVAIDPSFAVHKYSDPAAIQVLRGTGQAAEVKLYGADMMAQMRLVYWLGAFYNWASVVVEMNGPGDTLFHTLKTQGYKNLWHERATRPGWTTTHATRTVTSGQFLSLSVSGQMALRSGRLLEEMQVAASGDEGPHDLMDAYAIGCAAQSMSAAKG